MHFTKMISVIDSHTAGEPTRIIVDGFPPVKGRTMAERMNYLANHMDWLRKSLMREPRAHRDMFGGVLLPALDPCADAAVIFMDGGLYYNMCGHASLGICAMLVETGRIPVTPPRTIVKLETPAGIVEGTVTTDPADRVKDVSLVDVPSFAWTVNSQIDLPGHGLITVDIAFGGNFFVIVEAAQLGVTSIDPEHTNELIKMGIAIRSAANRQIQVQHPIQRHIQTIDICMITAPPTGPHADARNIVILGNAQADRSPCGTGTCARMAILHRKGLLQLNQSFRHESSIRSVFQGEIIAETQVDGIPAIIPRISCRPFLTGFHRFVIDPEDPFAEGFAF
ncbi:MAG: proline racemase family protein [Verrucomicrobia bacterium]|nr:proline racemase family protein [Verrucomicrobiota bacterium]MCG2680017.1 proline racemase family protein [Kiritimatiellia bacterium]MBU4247306.1 proline racemase family protein [Verrucomicrobiota bacterium]MBU4290689.1 proline racemase family protein [Verrucomicrobiota bacterium]MBU4428868.1 proline racemase family protein [Verrucomicrobiota bacterium]